MKQRKLKALEQLENLIEFEKSISVPVYVFGSFARLDFKANSDLDVYFEHSDEFIEQRAKFDIRRESGYDVLIIASKNFIKAIEKDFVSPTECLKNLEAFEDFDFIYENLAALALIKFENLCSNTRNYLEKNKEQELNEHHETVRNALGEDDLSKGLSAMFIRQLSSRIDVILEVYLSLTDHLFEPNAHLYDCDKDFAFVELCRDKHELLSQEESERFKTILDGLPLYEITQDDEKWIEGFYFKIEKRVRKRLEDMVDSK